MAFPLDDSWTLYLHYKDLGQLYNDNLEKLQDIQSVEYFWRTMNNVPKIYELFSDGYNTKKMKRNNATPCAYSFFRTSVKPCWEDPGNSNGFEFSIKSNTNFEDFQEKWINSLIILISNDKELYKFITGVRVVDVTKYTSVMYRLEFWVSDEIYRKEIQNSLIEDFKIDSKLSYRSHKNIKEN
jgi:hypothetical protein